MPDSDTKATATDIHTCLLRLLARREHSKTELMQKLLLRNFKTAAIMAILDYFAEKNWQSDQRFAESYIRSCISKGYGQFKIQAGLQERGVALAIITDCLSTDADFWAEHIKKVWQKKFGVMTKYGGQAFMKQQRFLQSRGFTTEQIKTLWAMVYEK